MAPTEAAAAAAGRQVSVADEFSCGPPNGSRLHNAPDDLGQQLKGAGLVRSPDEQLIGFGFARLVRGPKSLVHGELYVGFGPIKRPKTPTKLQESGPN